MIPPVSRRLRASGGLGACSGLRVCGTQRPRARVVEKDPPSLCGPWLPLLGMEARSDGRPSHLAGVSGLNGEEPEVAGVADGHTCPGCRHCSVQQTRPLLPVCPHGPRACAAQKGMPTVSPDTSTILLSKGRCLQALLLCFKNMSLVTKERKDRKGLLRMEGKRV